MVENFPASQQNVDGSTNWIMRYCSEVNWTYKNRWYRLITVKAIGFLYPNILDTLSNIFVGSSKRIKTSMLMH